MFKNDLFKYILIGLSSYILGLFSSSLFGGAFSDDNDKEPERETVVDNDFNYEIVQVNELKMEDGFIYTGGTRNNRRYGQGRMTTPKGTVYEGTWYANGMVDGSMITSRYEYTGQFKNLSPNGYGTMKYKNGSSYRGMWKGGHKSGIGLFVDSIGQKQFGLWKAGVIDKKTMNANVDKRSFGIDISHYNKIKDWGNMAIYTKKNGLACTTVPEKDYHFSPVDFVFVKATEGADVRDENYLSNMRNAKKYHKQRGSYHFMHLTTSSVENQLKNFLDYVVYEPGDLPPVLDIEVTKEAKEIGVKATREKVLKWLQVVEDSLGVKPIIYTFANMKRDYLNSPEFDGYDFWIAHHRSTEPEFKDYKIWQFTDKGRVHGNNNALFDVNIRRL